MATYTNRNYDNILAGESSLSGIAVMTRETVTVDTSDTYTWAQIHTWVGYYFIVKSPLGNFIDKIKEFYQPSYENDAFIPSSIEIGLEYKTAINTGPNSIYQIREEIIPARRIIDYKIQPEHNKMQYFNPSTEWVYYHSNNESYYGGKFFPTLGSIICYDENDEQITPTNVEFYPEVIEGKFEDAKTVIKWASNQSGKCFFHPGFSSDEKGDQSRLICDIPHKTYDVDNKYEYTIDMNVLKNRRSSATITTEPYLTLDAISNGRVAKTTRNNILNIVGPKLLHSDLVKHRGDYNTDILNVIYFDYTGEGKSIHNKKYTIDLAALSAVPGYSNIDLSKYKYEVGTVDSLGLFYDGTKYIVAAYVNAIEVADDTNYLIASNLVSLTPNRIEGCEKFTPMMKVNGIDGHVKILNRLSELKLTEDGATYSADYVVEYPLPPGQTSQERETYYDTETIDKTQLFYLQSHIKAGAVDWDTIEYYEENERDTFSASDGFTSVFLAASDIDTLPGSTYTQIIPDHISYENNIYKVKIISGFLNTEPNKDMRFFIVKSNKKWRYDKNKYESYSGREHPCYVSEIDTETLTHDYSNEFDSSPSLPDFKRWVSSYYRGFGYMDTETPLSTLNLEIWDNKSLTYTDKRTGNWRPLDEAVMNTFRSHMIQGRLLDIRTHEDVAPLLTFKLTEASGSVTTQSETLGAELGLNFFQAPNGLQSPGCLFDYVSGDPATPNELHIPVGQTKFPEKFNTYFSLYFDVTRTVSNTCLVNLGELAIRIKDDNVLTFERSGSNIENYAIYPTLPTNFKVAIVKREGVIDVMFEGQTITHNTGDNVNIGSDTLVSVTNGLITIDGGIDLQSIGLRVGDKASFLDGAIVQNVTITAFPGSSTTVQTDYSGSTTTTTETVTFSHIVENDFDFDMDMAFGSPEFGSSKPSGGFKLNKLLIFNKVISYDDFLRAVDGYYPTYYSDLSRYISNNKMYIRSRIDKLKAEEISKRYIDNDTLDGNMPFGGDGKFDWKDHENYIEEIRRFGLDYIRVESR